MENICGSPSRYMSGAVEKVLAETGCEPDVEELGYLQAGGGDRRDPG